MRSFFKKSDHVDAFAGLPKRGARGRAAPVHITAVAERTSGHDENLGSLIGDMRLALGMTPGELALRLGTTVDIIMILEQGRLRALPHWEETQWIVNGLCGLHQVDARPILQRIYEQTNPTHIGAPPDRGAGTLTRSAESRPERLTDRLSRRRDARPANATTERTGGRSSRRPKIIEPDSLFQAEPSPPVKAPAKTPKAPRRWTAAAGTTKRRGRALLAVAGPMVMIAAAVWTVQAQPRALREVIAVLPASMSKPMLGGLDALAVRLAPRRDGLRWIDVSDPRSRKADRLQVTK